MDDYARAHGHPEHSRGDSTEAHDLRVLDSAHANAQRGASMVAGKVNVTLHPGPPKKSWYPVRPVKPNMFAKGYLTMTKCIEFCLAVTCGCEDVPYDHAKLSKENADSGYPVIDTKPTWRFSKADLDQCGSGHGKVTSGLWMDWGYGVGGEIEICSKKFWEHALGAAGALGMA